MVTESVESEVFVVEDWVFVVSLVDDGLAEAGAEVVLAAIRVAWGREAGGIVLTRAIMARG